MGSTSCPTATIIIAPHRLRWPSYLSILYYLYILTKLDATHTLKAKTLSGVYSVLLLLSLLSNTDIQTLAHGYVNNNQKLGLCLAIDILIRSREYIQKHLMLKLTDQ